MFPINTLCTTQHISFEASFLKSASLVKLSFGDAGRMGTAVAMTAAPKLTVPIRGKFSMSHSGASQFFSPTGISKPNSILKLNVR
jgi:hypothetical protein